MSWEKQGYRDYWFQFKSNYIQLYKRNMAWATLHPIWFFRIRNPYDSNHVQLIKKERHMECKFLWTDTRSFIHFESHQLSHKFCIFKNMQSSIHAFHVSILYEFHAFSFSNSMLLKNHHVMEITIGHSHHTSYVNLLVQKCMFEHKYDMDCR